MIDTDREIFSNKASLTLGKAQSRGKTKFEFFSVDNKESMMTINEKELSIVFSKLEQSNMILHPELSPKGKPDFKKILASDKKYIIILDRNILTDLISLVTNGSLSNKKTQVLMGTLISVLPILDARLNSGIALMEFSQHKTNSIAACRENDLFHKIFSNYAPQTWINLATEKIDRIPIIESNKKEYFDFKVEDDHYKMHYLEMLILSQVYFNKKFTIIEKFEYFFNWITSNILICKYTTYYAAMALANRGKLFKKHKNNFANINKNCLNQAWDLSYLSLWSTFYYYENNSNDRFLFATLDKQLREVFMETHKENLEIYSKLFGENIRNEIIKILKPLYVKRDKPAITKDYLDNLIKKEKEELERILNNNAN